MNIRIAATSFGATLTLIVMLSATTTPALAARPSKQEPTKTPTVVDSRGLGSQYEQAMSTSMVDAKHGTSKNGPHGPPPTYESKSSKSKNEQSKSNPYPEGFDPNTMLESTQQGSSSSSTSPNTSVQQGNGGAAIGSNNGTPVLASGSIVPNPTPTPTNQQVPESVANAGYPGQAYPQGQYVAPPGTGSTGTAYQQVPGATASPTAQSATYPQTVGQNPGQGSPTVSYPQGMTAVNAPGSMFQMAPGSVVSSSALSAQTSTRADVRVVYVNSASNSSSTLYHFRIENAGTEPATAVSLSSSTREQSNTTSASKKVDEQYAPIASLAPGQTQDLVVTCAPQSGSRCVGASVEASAANDLNPANNGAQSYGQGN